MVAKSVRVAATAGVAVTEDGSGSGEADVALQEGAAPLVVRLLRRTRGGLLDLVDEEEG